MIIDALQYSNWDRSRFEALQRGGLTAVHVTVSYWEDARATLTNIGKWHRHFQTYGDLIMQAKCGADILSARDEGKTAIILGAQNCSPIDDELALVQVMRELGLMIMQLTYNNQSLLGAGCYEAEDAGLTRFGRLVIQEMNRVGMIVDLSHSGARTTLDAIDQSERPVAITHANPAAWHPAVRNKSDEVLKILADAGGMLGFSVYPLHLKGGSQCRRDDFCAMIARTADLMGVEQIGIGSDLCCGWGYEVLEWMRSGRWTFAPDHGEAQPQDRPAWPDQPDWIKGPEDLATIADGLRAVGFSADEIALVMGGNWLRFFSDGFAAQA